MASTLDIAVDVVREAGKRLVPHFGNVTLLGNKGESPASALTQLDIDTETFIEAKLKEYEPTIGFRGEENGDKRGGGKFWLVDPIDGTGNFVRGIPVSTTMLSLIDNGQVTAAVIYNFMTDEMFTAEKGKGAFLNGKPIHVSTRPLNKSYLAIESRVPDPEDVESFLALRRTGCFVHTVSAGFEFSLVAAGRLDGRVTIRGLGSDWDYAPGSLLVTEAGGAVANIGAQTYDYTNHRFLAVNQQIYRELTEGEHAIFPITIK